MRLILLLTLTTAIAISSSEASSQATPGPIKCVQPAQTKPDEGCVLTLSRNPGSAVIVVKLEQGGAPLPGVKVRFRATGNSVYDTLDVSDSSGEARTTWSGAAGSVVTASATIGSDESRVEIQIKAPAPAPTPLTLSSVPRKGLPALGDRQSWYEKRQLRDPIPVVIGGAKNEASCDSAQVVFRAVGGSTSPDSVRGQWTEATKETPGSCTARAHWRLGEGVGRQHLRAHLVGNADESLQFTSTARALPRLTIGLVVSRPSGYHRLEITADTVTVTRTVGDSTVEMKRVTTTEKAQEVERDFAMTPVLGFDWPMVPQWGRLRVSAAASLASPTQDWFFGVSLVQIAVGLPHEAVGVSLHGVVHVSRRTVVKNPEACLQRQSCGTGDELVPASVGFMFTVDQTSLLSNLTTIFGIK